MSATTATSSGPNKYAEAANNPTPTVRTSAQIQILNDLFDAAALAAAELAAETADAEQPS